MKSKTNLQQLQNAAEKLFNATGEQLIEKIRKAEPNEVFTIDDAIENDKVLVMKKVLIKNAHE